MSSPMQLTLIFIASLLGASSSYALDVNITKSIAYVDTVHDSKIVRIQREQDQDHVITGGFSKTSRKCPPFCVRPIQIAPHVKTVGEVELLKFIKQHLNNGTGVLIDARTPSWHKRGTIPGSINIPFTIFSSDQTEPLVLKSALAKLGVKHRTNRNFMIDTWSKIQQMIGRQPQMIGNWDYSQAKELLLWCNGMWCGQSPRAIRALVKLGYPPEKIRYYRGGMQSWLVLGLSVVIPEGEGAESDN
jgi:rhodanese-related sulfurtransferase